MTKASNNRIEKRVNRKISFNPEGEAASKRLMAEAEAERVEFFGDLRPSEYLNRSERERRRERWRANGWGECLL